MLEIVEPVMPERLKGHYIGSRMGSPGTLHLPDELSASPPARSWRKATLLIYGREQSAGPAEEVADAQLTDGLGLLDQSTPSIFDDGQPGQVRR